MDVGGLGWEAGSKLSSCYIIASASLFILPSLALLHIHAK